MNGKVGRPQNSDKIKTGPGFKLANILNSALNSTADMTNDELAECLGYSRPNIISMWKTGRTKVPLEKLIPLAKLMDMDLLKMIIYWFDQYVDKDGHDQIVQAITGRFTPEEEWLIREIRQFSQCSDFSYKEGKTFFDLKRAMEEVIDFEKITKK